LESFRETKSRKPKWRNTLLGLPETVPAHKVPGTFRGGGLGLHAPREPKIYLGTRSYIG